ncbi:5-oxoprolinase subunit B family protein [Meridianimarinicoccus sp. RP-17]|uniref:5-oxoprolinase subunit B family protein n=1 Tax=Meridianimarinicoccus zhengii TaxID=2056810 RepID=UPI000DAC4634|nr:carboxyltransferase domain-containing protein [Phycocomes zhengii]
MTDAAPQIAPQIATLGVDGLLIRFADRLTEPANRAALAFAAAVARADPPGLAEVSTGPVSVLVRLDLPRTDPDAFAACLSALLAERDWTQAPLPEGRRLWRVPAVFGTDLAPQLDEAADLAGLKPDEAVESLTAEPLRVQTIGFAPGQPYLGQLPDAWDIPRQEGLSPRVPPGALTVAIRQVVLFSVASPTGWRHVGQTAARLFDPDRTDPFLLRPGDAVLFAATDREGLEAARADGGAEVIPWP